MILRSDLKAGDMFTIQGGSSGAGAPIFVHEVFVVLDHSQEMGFWGGGRWSWGSTAPSMQVMEVSWAKPRRP